MYPAVQVCCVLGVYVPLESRVDVPWGFVSFTCFARCEQLGTIALMPGRLALLRKCHVGKVALAEAHRSASMLG